MKIKIILKTVVILFLLIFLLSDAFGLPSSGTAGHSDLSIKSAEIKYNLPESEINGLRNSLKNTFGSLKAFQDFLSSSNVAEDGMAGMFGALHFYDPTTQCGYLCLFSNGKETAKDWYKQAVSDYCGPTPI